jgi:hypothetical protein
MKESGSKHLGPPTAFHLALRYSGEVTDPLTVSLITGIRFSGYLPQQLPQTTASRRSKREMVTVCIH